MKKSVSLVLLYLVLLVWAPAEATEALSSEAAAPANHSDPVVPILINLVVILIAAKIGGDLVERVGQPSVLGELAVGVVLGNLSLLGVTVFTGLRTDAVIDIFARLGVIMLLFEVGLESNIKKMIKVGLPSFLVAIVGVITPFALGYGVSKWFMPAVSPHTHLFIGATLTATSVGITARVFKDLNRLHLPETQIILGAAVVDDILGLIVLAVVAGIITMGAVSLASIALTSLKASGFIVAALLIGTRLAAPWLGMVAQRMRVSGAVLIAALVFCFTLAITADMIGLATIVGAFAAGLILEDHYFRMTPSRQTDTVEGLTYVTPIMQNHTPRMETIGGLIAPISSFLVPIFFVLMGIRVHLEMFLNGYVLAMALGCVLAAIVGKLVCGLAVRRSYQRLVISLGMVPRGEVGLIFAAIGRELHVIDDAVFSSVVLMVIVTTLVTPPLLTWRLKRKTMNAGEDQNPVAFSHGGNV